MTWTIIANGQPLCCTSCTVLANEVLRAAMSLGRRCSVFATISGR